MVTDKRSIIPGFALSVLLALGISDAQARDPVPAPAPSAQAAPNIAASASLIQNYSVTVRGRVTDTKGGGLGGAQIYWAHALQAAPTDPCADPATARSNPGCGDLPRISGGAIQDRLAEAQRTAAEEAAATQCAIDPGLIASRGPLATTGADGSYHITLRLRGNDEACSRMVSELSLRDLPPLAAKKSGYSFRRDKGGAAPGILGGKR